MATRSPSTAAATVDVASRPMTAAAAKWISTQVSAGAEVGFDPTIIIAIISALMQMFANCKKTEAEAVDTMRHPGVFDRLMIRNACRDHAKNVRETTALVAATRQFGATAPRETLVGIYAENRAA